MKVEAETHRELMPVRLFHQRNRTRSVTGVHAVPMMALRFLMHNSAERWLDPNTVKSSARNERPFHAGPR